MSDAALSVPIAAVFEPPHGAMLRRAVAMKTVHVDWRYRLAIASRAVAATAAGYALASGVAAALAAGLVLCMARADAVLTATMLAWLAYALAAAWAFYARTAWGAWGGTLLPAAALGVCALLPRWIGA